MATRDTVRCPVCGNRDVRGGKYGVDTDGGRDVNEYEFYCHRCGTLEGRRDDAPDFRQWKQRWTSPAQ
jgi:C4-type Zn-finger protein